MPEFQHTALKSSASIHDSIEMLSQGWGWVHCEGEGRQKRMMRAGPLLAGAGWMIVGLPSHLPQLPYRHCSQQRTPVNPLASPLSGTLCCCLLQVQGQQQRGPECT